MRLQLFAPAVLATLVAGVSFGCGGSSSDQDKIGQLVGTTAAPTGVASPIQIATTPGPSSTVLGLPTLATKHISGACLQIDYPAAWYIGDSRFSHGVDLIVLQTFVPEVFGHGGIPPGAIKVDLDAQLARPGVPLTPASAGQFVRSVSVAIDGTVRDIDISYFIQEGGFYGATVGLTKGNVALNASVYATNADDAARGAQVLSTLQLCDQFPAQEG